MLHVVSGARFMLPWIQSYATLLRKSEQEGRCMRAILLYVFSAAVLTVYGGRI